MTAPAAASWRRNQYAMTSVVFVVYTGFAFVLPFLPRYVRDLGVTRDDHVALWAGILIGVTPLLAALLAPVWGRLGDRYGQKRVAVRALLSYVILLLLSAIAGSVWDLFLLRAAMGLFGGIGPLGISMATALAPRDQTGRAVGAVQSAQILAAAVGPFAGGVLSDAIGIPRTFVVAAAFCLVALVLVIALYTDAPPAHAAQADARGSLWDTLRIPQVPTLLAVLLLVNFIGRSFTPILPDYLASLGVARAGLGSSTGLLISVYSAAAALSAVGLGRVSRHLAPRGLLLATLVGGAVTVLPMALVSSFHPLLGLGVLLGLVSGGSLTLCYTIGGLLVPSGSRATAFGFFSGAALLGGAVSPSIAGLLVRWDLRGIFYLDALIYAILVVALLPRALAAAPRPVSQNADV
jgi:DHA1 family multidrug resistance protein-like MFS transporter